MKEHLIREKIPVRPVVDSADFKAVDVKRNRNVQCVVPCIDIMVGGKTKKQRVCLTKTF